MPAGRRTRNKTQRDSFCFGVRAQMRAPAVPGRVILPQDRCGVLGRCPHMMISHLYQASDLLELLRLKARICAPAFSAAVVEDR